MVVKFESPLEVEEKVKEYLGEYYEVAYDYVPYYFRLRSDDEEKFLFQDSIHWPSPLKPIDMFMIQLMQWPYCMPQHLLHKFPTSRGADWKIVNGYAFIIPLEVSDPEEIKKREEHFMNSAKKYYSQWNELWNKKLDEEVLPSLDWMESLDFRNEELSYKFIENFDRMIHTMFRLWEIHFEFLGLGYAAYVLLINTAKELFPGIDDQTITKFVQGLGTIMMETDRKFYELAKLAIDLGISSAFQKKPDEILDELGKSEGGRRWLEEFEEVMKKYGNRIDSGLYFGYRTWREDYSTSLSIIQNYIAKILSGEDPLPPKEELERERERIISEYLELLEDGERERFKEIIGLAQLVYPYVEDHNFYIDQKADTLFRLKLLEIGERFAEKGYISDPEDIAFLTVDEIRHALYDMLIDYGGRLYSCSDFKELIEKRKKVYELQSKWTPPKVMGIAPEKITEPLFVQLWGVTSEAIELWKSQKEVVEERVIKGFPASPGVYEGYARVLHSPDEIPTLAQGEILVVRCTTPAWTAVFPVVGAVVTDIGGLMSHAAIISREYGIPAVVGSLFATSRIKTGQRIRVDGNRGIVEILD